MSERYSSIDNHFPWKVHFPGVMERFYYGERMFMAKSRETLVLKPSSNRVTLYRIFRDGVLWSRITKDARLQEPNFVFSDETAVFRPQNEIWKIYFSAMPVTIATTNERRAERRCS